jgi:predicted metallo-beta-lactamase superfamily hydrolase
LSFLRKVEQAVNNSQERPGRAPRFLQELGSVIREWDERDSDIEYDNSDIEIPLVEKPDQ